MNQRLFLRYTLLFFLALFMINTNVQSASLWNNSKSIYSDRSAHQIGDLITIIIEETTSASQQASTDASQSSQVSVGAGSGILDFIKAFGVNESDNNSATGVTSRSGNLSSKVTVEIVDILENGNFKIQGNKEITVNDEQQRVNLTGVIRPEDITAENTVDSTYVANVKINYHGEGSVGDKQKPGIISRILNWLF
ncbi:flagellar basal body L-ring protein FlgH [Orenia marismortui]|uniref:Flagellar L-ring protein n=1 Tax=Orenia marismortui TaxID=46469 RepID=A0A4R8HLE9_9FIRM|nr:flagellar basal body L-ring protein FlgH [Orenia marismortui]TDX59184.1 flagellar L-ring protein precursor FlgH [Orenia marismortui]